MTEVKKTTSTTGKRRPKGEIKYKITLDDGQKEAKRLVIENEIVIITGRAGTGKSAVTAQTALDLLFKRELEKILITRPTVEVGRTLGLLPGSISEKVNPYLEPFFESLYSCYDEEKVKKHIENTNITGKALQFIRGNNFYDKSLNILEEAQNSTKAEMLSFLTRLNKGARIVIVGDLDQQDTRESYTGLHYAIELANKIQEIKHIKLKNNHRSDLVGKILDYEYER